MTRDRTTAAEWLQRFEGAGLDGVIAKPEDAAYQPGKRAMFKIKHARTADCVVAGFRWHKNGARTSSARCCSALFDDKGMLHHVGVTSSFTMAKRKELVKELEPLRKNALASHPWKAWAEASRRLRRRLVRSQRMPGGQSRWSAGKDLSWEPLRIERVCEVKYDHMQGDRFRHAATFLRWRDDKAPQDCRYDQLEVTPAFELSAVFGATLPGLASAQGFGIGGSFGAFGRCFSGTCCRLMRMRVHVDDRPRIESTSTSAGSSNAATFECFSFQVSS